MKVTINADGVMELDVCEGETKAAAALIREVQGANAEESHGNSHDSQMATLSAKQRATYEGLVSLDHPDGIHVAGLSDILGETASAVGYRLNLMTARGLAVRVARGRYRAVECV